MHAKVLVNTKDMSRDEWLAARGKGIGGSDVAALFGLSPYKSPMELYAEKIGAMPEKPKTWAMTRGNALEEPLAQWYAEQTGNKVQRRNKLFQHPEYPFLLANIDRWVVGHRKGLECKTASPFSFEKWKDGDAPLDYVLQCQHYMAVLGFEEWDLVYCIDGHDPEWITIKRDEETIRQIIDKASDFWNINIRQRIPPSVDSTESCRNALKYLYARPVPESVTELDAASTVWAGEYQKASEDIKSAMERKEYAANMMKSALGDNEIGMYRGERIVTWKASKKGSRTIRVIGGSSNE